MTALTPFDFEGRAVRVVEDEAGVPWFVARDVCECLGIRNSSDAVSRLDEDERSDVGVSDTSSNGVVQARSFLAVSEPGVYKLCFRSNKPEAKRLIRWLTHDVLPSLRRTGRYELPDTTPEPPPVPVAANHRADVLVSAARGFNALVRTGRTVGLSRIRAVRSANEATVRATGIDLIDELDAHDVICPSAEQAEFNAAVAGLVDIWAGQIARWLSGQAPGDDDYPPRLRDGAPIAWTTTDEVLQYALGLDPARNDRPAQMRIAAVMRSLGWQQVRTLAGDGHRERRWLAPLARLDLAQ